MNNPSMFKKHDKDLENSWAKTEEIHSEHLGT